MKKVNRGLVLGIVFLLAAGMAFAGGRGQAGGAAPAADGTFTIRFNQGTPAGATQGIVAETFKTEVEKRSNGRIKVELYYNSQLGEQTQNIALINRGAFEMSGGGATYIQEYMPELGVLNMGYIYKNFEHANAYLNGESGRKLFDRIANQTGWVPLGAYYYGARNVCLTVDRPIAAPADLADIKMRTNGTDPMMFLLKAMGSNPVGIPLNETYTALQTGTVNGQENPINGVVDYKYYEVSKSMTFTRHWIDCTWLGIGQKFLQGLPADLQQVVRDSGRVACEVQSQASLKAEQDNVDFCKTQGLKFYEVDTSAIRNQVIAAYQDKAKEDKWDMTVFDEIQKVGENY